MTSMISPPCSTSSQYESNTDAGKIQLSSGNSKASQNDGHAIFSLKNNNVQDSMMMKMENVNTLVDNIIDTSIVLDEESCIIREEVKEDEKLHKKTKIQFEGYLRKRYRSSYYMGSWRYCVLDNQCFRWYLTEEHAKKRKYLRGEIFLDAFEPWSGQGTVNIYPNAFAIRTKQGKVLLCSAKTSQEKKQWIKCIQQVIRREEEKEEEKHDEEQEKIPIDENKKEDSDTINFIPTHHGRQIVPHPSLEENKSTTVTAPPPPPPPLGTGPPPPPISSSSTSTSSTFTTSTAMMSTKVDLSMAMEEKEPFNLKIREEKEETESLSRVSTTSTASNSSIETECTLCTAKFKALVTRRFLCGSCERPFCKRHCRTYISLPQLETTSLSKQFRSNSNEVNVVRKCCRQCVMRQEFITYSMSMGKRLEQMAIKCHGENLEFLMQYNHLQLKNPQIYQKTLEKIGNSPMELVRTIKLLYQTRYQPDVFRVVCERLPFYVENCIDKVENLWYQILHLFQCLDINGNKKAKHDVEDPFLLQQFYFKRYLRAICRRSPRIALHTIWHVQAAALDDADRYHLSRHRSSNASHSLFCLLGFLYPSHQASMRLWKELFLVDSPLHQQMEILKHINQINDQSERLIAATTANIQEGTKIWIEKWLNAKNIEEFESSATEVAKFSPKFCEFHSNVTYKTLTPAASPVVDSSYNGSFDSSFALETLVSDQVNFVQVLAGISERLRHVQPVEKRGKKLEKELEHLNSTLSSSALYPLCTASDDLFKVVRIPPQEGKVFSTKMRAPTLIFLETIPVDVSSYLMEDKLCAFAGSNRYGGPLYRDELMDSLEVQEMDEEANSDLISDSNTLRDSIGSEISSTSHSEAFRLWQSELNDQVEGGLLDMGFADKRKQQELILHGKLQCSLLPLSETMAILEDKVPATISHTFSKHAHYQAEVHGHQVDNLVYESKVYGESWEERCERIRLSSPMGHLPGWKLFSIIVKTNDDLRQEMFAMQMINKFKMIFDTKRLDLWLRPYRIVATGANIGILETINDACSLDHLKKNAENPNLLAYFKLVYGNNGTDDRKFLEAQKNFISSMAAYSIVSYVLLVKDRHNGNLLLGSEGHLIHIDFGFILGIAPGGMFSIEDAPFKLTSEMVDVMGGIDSTGFKRFQKLICSGLIALQRYETEISALLQTTGQNSPFPCFVHAKVPCMIKELRERLCVGLTRAQVEKKVEQLIRKSYNAWGTRHYDAFQQRSNNIHP